MTLETDEFIAASSSTAAKTLAPAPPTTALFAKSSCDENARAVAAAISTSRTSQVAAVDHSQTNCTCGGGRMHLSKCSSACATPRQPPTASASVIRSDNLMTAPTIPQSVVARSLALDRRGGTAERAQDIQSCRLKSGKHYAFDAIAADASTASALGQLPQSRRYTNPATALAALKSPITQAAPPRYPSRRFLHWGLRTRPRVRGNNFMGPAIRKHSIRRHRACQYRPTFDRKGLDVEGSPNRLRTSA